LQREISNVAKVCGLPAFRYVAFPRTIVLARAIVPPVPPAEPTTSPAIESPAEASVTSDAMTILEAFVTPDPVLTPDVAVTAEATTPLDVAPAAVLADIAPVAVKLDAPWLPTPPQPPVEAAPASGSATPLTPIPRLPSADAPASLALLAEIAAAIEPGTRPARVRRMGLAGPPTNVAMRGPAPAHDFSLLVEVTASIAAAQTEAPEQPVVVPLVVPWSKVPRKRVGRTA
jgi:hypothetical protein